MQQSDYEIVGKFGFESRTDRLFFKIIMDYKMVR